MYVCVCLLVCVHISTCMWAHEHIGVHRGRGLTGVFPIALHLIYFGRLSDEPSACQSDWSSEPAHSRDLPLKCGNYRQATTRSWRLCGAGVQGLALTFSWEVCYPRATSLAPCSSFLSKKKKKSELSPREADQSCGGFVCLFVWSFDRVSLCIPG